MEQFHNSVELFHLWILVFQPWIVGFVRGTERPLEFRGFQIAIRRVCDLTRIRAGPACGSGDLGAGWRDD